MNKLSKIAKMLGSRGGKKSVESRFEGKTKAEISEMMSKVRSLKPEEFTSSQTLVDCLNAAVLEDNLPKQPHSKP